MVIKNLAAHRRRNQMTGLIYSLSLGFLLFLSISCRMQINVSSMEQLKEHASYFVVLTKNQNTLHVPTLEQIMLMNNHIIAPKFQPDRGPTVAPKVGRLEPPPRPTRSQTWPNIAGAAGRREGSSDWAGRGSESELARAGPAAANPGRAGHQAFTGRSAFI